MGGLAGDASVYLEFMSMRPATEEPFLPVYRWVVLVIAMTFIFMMESDNAGLATQFQQSGLGFHVSVGIASTILGVVLGVPITSVCISVKIVLRAIFE